ncbi:MAG TPA: peptide deformylase [Bacteroidia bacterium]|nr:peptide deformylase [Bacteroidia bacterium]HNT79154.1 peptide deformylase [Bacteroidia bacterium]
MILPIIAFGDPVLKKKALDFDLKDPKLDQLIEDMFETMYEAAGVGLAAPQVGLSRRLFVVDASPFEEDDPKMKDFKKVFINPVLLDENGEEWTFNEGCLSIPGVREDVNRKAIIKIKYYDQKRILREEEYNGLAARIIQHEYDHIEGILFTDKLSAFKKRLIKGKLSDIQKGKAKVSYKMRFYRA